MRKPTGALLASVMLVSITTMGATSAGAASGTICKASNGTAAFTPTLPKLGSTTKVFAKLAISGVLISCSGGSVTGGSLKVTTPKSKKGSNCATLAAYNPSATTGTEVITWNTGATSTVALKLLDVKNQPRQTRLQGTVTAGLFKGLKQSGLTEYTEPKGACVTSGLSKVTYRAVTAITIK